MKSNLKLFLSAALIAATASSAWADDANLKKALIYYQSGFPEHAKAIVLKSLESGSSNKDMSYFALGDIYYTLNMPDSASYYYKKGLEINPNSQANAVGLNKLLIKANPKAAEETFKAMAGGKNKKNAELLTWIGQAYLDSGDLENASDYAQKAKSADNKYDDAYLLQGDIYAAQKMPGKAAEQYEQAIYFDKEHEQSYIKHARLYSTVNPNLAIEVLNKLLALDAESAIAYREMAEVYYSNGKFAEAEKAYKKFIELDNFFSESEMAKYATIMFYNKDFQNSADIASTVLERNPNNFVMQRLLMYNTVELKKFDLAEEYADDFMDDPDTGQYIYLDYIYYGRLLAHRGKNDQAYALFKKALEKDPSKVETYKELGDLYEKNGDYPNALIEYQNFVDKGGDKVTLSDIFSVGKLNYNAASDTAATPEAKVKYIADAEKSFNQVVERAPDNYLGYLWLGRTNMLKDPESTQGLAKPYYEKVIEVLGDSDRNKSQLLEAYNYLGYYYFALDKLAESLPYWEKMLVLDPENSGAKQAVDGIREALKK